MGEASKENGKGISVTPTDFNSLAEVYNPLSFNPMMPNPVAAFAAATALGFGLATRMTGLVLSGMQEAMRTSGRDRGDAKSAFESQEPVSDHKVSAVVTKDDGAMAEVPVAPVKPRRRQAETKKTVVVKASVVKTETARLAPKAKKQTAANKVSDLKQISGIGPKVETLLHKAGVQTFADIAGWSLSDVERFDRELGLEGRILRDDWIGQAQILKSL